MAVTHLGGVNLGIVPESQEEEISSTHLFVAVVVNLWNTFHHKIIHVQSLVENAGLLVALIFGGNFAVNFIVFFVMSFVV